MSEVVKADQAKQSKLYLSGKRIIVAIALTNLLFAVAAAFIRFNLVTLLIQTALSIALLCGVKWVRYLFAAGAGMGAVYTLYALISGAFNFSLNKGINKSVIILLLIVVFLYSATAFVLLLFSKAVKEYMWYHN